MQKQHLNYIHLPPEGELPALEGKRPFTAIVVVEAGVPEMTMWETARWLVDAGCALALTWGKQCEDWREAIEDAGLEAVNYEEVPDEQSLIVTAHEDEDLSEAFWYARHRAVHPAHELRDTLILHIADVPRRDELEAEYRDA